MSFAVVSHSSCFTNRKGTKVMKKATTMISVRIPHELKAKLVEVTELEGKEHCSDLLKELIQARVDMDDLSSLSRRSSVATEAVSLAVKIEEMLKLEERRENLARQIEEKGGEKADWLSNTCAPAYLVKALRG